jgi:hypothetical protein
VGEGSQEAVTQEAMRHEGEALAGDAADAPGDDGDARDHGVTGAPGWCREGPSMRMVWH